MSAVKPFLLGPLLLLKGIAKLVILLILVLFGALTLLSVKDRADVYEVSLDGVVIPQFDEQTIAFEPSYDKTRTLPFAANELLSL